MTEITINELLEKGYKEHSMPLFHKYAKQFFQKKITNNEGTKYYIDVYAYDTAEGLNFEFEAQFNKQGYTINMTIFAIDDNHSLAFIEQEIEKLWANNQFEFYELN